MTVWVLVAVIRVHEILGGHVAEFIGVYATATACEERRAMMQRYEADTHGDTVWKCLREVP